MDNEWGAKYQAGEQCAVWPWSDVVSLVMRYVKPQHGAHVLELGPGMGANVPLFQALECEYSGIDASQTAVEALRSQWPQFCFWTGDFTQDVDYFPSESLDLVVDRAALIHNPMDAIERCLGLVHDRLKPGGWFVGVDWFGDLVDEGYGNMLEEVKETRFRDLGHVTFVDSQAMMRLFKAFYVVCFEHKVVEDYLNDEIPLATWNIVAQRE